MYSRKVQSLIVNLIVTFDTLLSVLAILFHNANTKHKCYIILHHIASTLYLDGGFIVLKRLETFTTDCQCLIL